MTRALTIVLLLALSACTSNSHLFRRGPKPDANVEAQYARAMQMLAPGANVASLDSAVHLLDAYLAHAGHIERRDEATVVRRLAGDAVQLSKVAAALQQERADRTKAAEPTAAAPAARSDDSVKEIQRLKDELAAANAELERIRKRLATQKP
ncbi:MAG TPA: hypothetical protein VFO66_13720 [Gemmatimonadaceae bacterium]|nr:hypothetical protein [Gemmatimonadaceae bacterium]